MIKKILLTIDRSFDAGNRENFILNEILLVINIFLLFGALLSMLHAAGLIYIFDETWHMIHRIEFFFGILFLIEHLLRTIYVYIPDKKLFTLYPFVNILVIISLLLPGIFNIAFLRIIWIIKMFKIYHLRNEDKKLLAKNPRLAKK